MTRRTWKPAVILLAVVSLMVGLAAGKPSAVPFEEARMIIEVNATDGDAGLQVFLDHDAWSAVQISRPDGHRIIDIKNKNELKDFGLTELFSESSEPPFTEFPIEEFKKLWPEGEYVFKGRTIEGDRLESTVTLSHDIPEGPEILAPEEGDTFPRNEARVRWRPGSQPAGVEIVGYQVIVEREDPLRLFSVDLPAGARTVKIPAAYLQPGVDYKVEVLAIEASGNQTLTELDFETE
jgi:hypothetical protein